MDDVTLLTRLIGEAERVLVRNGRVERGDHEELHARILERTAVPTEHARVVDGHTLTFNRALLIIDMARSCGDVGDVLLWSQIAGVILPRVRLDLFEALRQRNGAGT